MRIARLTYDVILTILVEIKSIINSRPWTYISDNHDQNFITPYHLICGRHINEKCYKYDGRNEIASDQIREDFSRKLKNVTSYFIKRFEDEYITAIQELAYYNHKKFKNSEQLVTEDAVLVKEDNFGECRGIKDKLLMLLGALINLSEELK